MCKDKWNGLNFDYEKVSNYHSNIGHHTPLQDLTMEEQEKHHLPRQFNKEFYDHIKSVQGKKTLNTPSHVNDVHAKGDEMYIPTQEQDSQDFIATHNLMYYNGQLISQLQTI